MTSAFDVAQEALVTGGLTARQIMDSFKLSTIQAAISIMHRITESPRYTAHIDHNTTPMTLRVSDVNGPPPYRPGCRAGRRGVAVVGIPTEKMEAACPGPLVYTSALQAQERGGFDRCCIARAIKSGKTYAGYFWYKAEDYIKAQEV